MGSLDAILVALGFRLFGEKVLVIRVLQGLLFLATVFTTVLLSRRIIKSDRAALYAGLLLSLPTVNVTLYSTVSLGGYGEMLLIGNLLLLGGLPLAEQVRDNTTDNRLPLYVSVFLWSFGAGFAFWVFGLTLVYSLPIIGLLIWSAWKSENRTGMWKTGCIGLAGGLIGSLPWWFEALINGNLLILSELAGGAIADVNQGVWLLRPLTRLVNLLIFGGSVIMGIRPPWSVQWLVMPALPLILVFWVIVFLYSLRLLQDKTRRNQFIPIAAIGLVLSVGFILSPYGDDPSGRYFLPLSIPMVIFGALALTDLLKKYPILQIGTLALVLLYNLTGTIQAERSSATGITTQIDKITQIDHKYINELAKFLNDKNITRGYTNYWISYPLAFLSEEELIFVPRLPYHQDFRYTARDDRYPPYGELVKNSEEVAYITTNHPELDNYLRQQFRSKNLSWRENKIGDFLVFYNLSDLIHPQEMDLGTTTTP